MAVPTLVRARPSSDAADDHLTLGSASSDRGRIWRAVVLVIVSFASLNVVLLQAEPWLLRVTLHDGNYTVARLVNLWDGPRPNIVLMGSSRVYMGLDPAQIEADLAHEEGVQV